MDDQRAALDLTGVLARLDQLEARNDRLEADNAALRIEMAALAAPDPGPPTAPSPVPAPATATTSVIPADGAEPPDRRVGRRQALRTGLAAAGAAAVAGAVLLDGEPAAAANGDAVIAGSLGNTATTPTDLTVTGTAAYGLGAGDATLYQPGNSPAVVGYATGSTFETGIMGITSVTNDVNVTALQARAQGLAIGAIVTSDTNTAVIGRSSGGITTAAFNNTGAGPGVSASGGDLGMSARSTGASGTALQAIGGRFGATVLGTSAALWLAAQDGRGAPTADAFAHIAGELVEDVDGNLWLCTVAGTPGTFRKVGGPATAGQFHNLLTPVRVYDSRPGTFPGQGPKTPLAANSARTVDLKVAGSTVPADATAVALNVLLVNAATGNGNFTIWANGATRPLANTLVWGGGAGRFSTFAITSVDTAARCQVQASLQTDLTVDVVGYYR